MGQHPFVVCSSILPSRHFGSINGGQTTIRLSLTVIKKDALPLPNFFSAQRTSMYFSTTIVTNTRMCTGQKHSAHVFIEADDAFIFQFHEVAFRFYLCVPFTNKSVEILCHVFHLDSVALAQKRIILALQADFQGISFF